MDDLDIVSPFVSEHIKLFPLLYHQFFLRVSKLENPLDLEDNYLVLCVLYVFPKEHYNLQYLQPVVFQ